MRVLNTISLIFPFNRGCLSKCQVFGSGLLALAILILVLDLKVIDQIGLREQKYLKSLVKMSFPLTNLICGGIISNKWN